MAAARLVLAVAFAALGCGESERDRVEDAVRERSELLAGEPAAVRCERASVMWGCSVQLTDGRTQACQVRVGDDGEPRGVGCQPIRGE